MSLALPITGATTFRIVEALDLKEGDRIMVYDGEAGARQVSDARVAVASSAASTRITRAN